MQIFSFPTFNLTKVLLTAEEVGESYNLQLLDVAKGEHKTPEHLARHPLGKVPAVEIDGANYFESNAICRFLAERHNNVLYGNTAEERAVVNQWVDMITLHIGRWLTVLFFENVIKRSFFDNEPDKIAVDEAMSFLAQQLPVIEKQLTSNTYLAGDTFTLADIIAFSYFTIVSVANFDLSAYPKILSWKMAIEQRPAYKKALANIPGQDMLAALIK